MLLMMVFVLGCQQVDNTTMTYIGTDYVNCHESEITGNPDSTLTGLVEEIIGSRMDPYRYATINSMILTTGSRFVGYDELLGERITAEGYYGKQTIGGAERDVFFVTKIRGWKMTCCNSVPSDTRIVSDHEVCFWFEK